MLGYALVNKDVVVSDNSKITKSLNVFSGEVVRVIQCVGTVAIIKPYNKRSMYMIHSNYLDFSISQKEKDYYVALGVRRLRGL